MYTKIAIPVSGLQTLEVQCVAVTADWISSVRASSVCVFFYFLCGQGGSQQRGAGSAGCIGGDYLGQDTVGPPGGDPINCIMM